MKYLHIKDLRLSNQFNDEFERMYSSYIQILKLSSLIHDLLQT